MRGEAVGIYVVLLRDLATLGLEERAEQHLLVDQVAVARAAAEAAQALRRHIAEQPGADLLRVVERLVQDHRVGEARHRRGVLRRRGVRVAEGPYRGRVEPVERVLVGEGSFRARGVLAENLRSPRRRELGAVRERGHAAVEVPDAVAAEAGV